MPRTIIGRWTYSGNPAGTARDKVRWLVGDVEDTDRQCSDEEIAAALADAGNNTVKAAVAVAEFLAAYYTREIDKSVSTPGGGSTNLALSSRADRYRKLATSLRESMTLAVAPWSAAVRVTRKDEQGNDEDETQPYFRVGLHDDVQAGWPTADTTKDPTE